jgi:hypothetical protein
VDGRLLRQGMLSQVAIYEKKRESKLAREGVRARETERASERERERETERFEEREIALGVKTGDSDAGVQGPSSGRSAQHGLSRAVAARSPAERWVQGRTAAHRAPAVSPRAPRLFCRGAWSLHVPHNLTSMPPGCARSSAGWGCSCLGRAGSSSTAAKPPPPSSPASVPARTAGPAAGRAGWWGSCWTRSSRLDPPHYQPVKEVCTVSILDPFCFVPVPPILYGRKSHGWVGGGVCEAGNS